ncbi:hypothetical protein PsorP6_016865 [Peronosclerospora sorghi]|uniref:Uncharacterized protein n=1 Tax=Peronosclerospora sorghi TaxID=230839 RepID=A0ACC0WDP1_9STRA|nr:hypothetical protein PsorP6_016865 [Peronosclerospora sorghi]
MVSCHVHPFASGTKRLTVSCRRRNPTETSKFSVGCGGAMKAAYVDITSTTGKKYQRAPTGALTSDVNAQSFFPSGHIVLNGTKRGGLWGWDLRSRRRIFEWDRATNASEPTGSILDIHVLRDGRRAVLERSNGELRLVDLRRTLCPVVEFVPGVPKRYLPHLRCAIDTNESVVVAGGDVQHPRTIQSFDLRHGRLVASIDVQSAHGVETPSSTLVQQVQFMSGPDGSYYDDMPGIWAIARNELFVCTGRRPDRVKE